MAKLIPPLFTISNLSPGEKVLFEEFKSDENTKGWVIFHSLGLAKHQKRIQGELDFVIAVPNEGILCLEIKAGKVERKEGIWIYGSGNNMKKSTVGPFRQASDAMHSLREFIIKTSPSLSNILFFSGVFFTYIDFDEKSPEWHYWQFADRSVLDKFPVAECCKNILKNAHHYIKEKSSASWYDPIASRPTHQQLDQLINILRKDFEIPVSPRTMIKKSEELIWRFTKEQFRALDVLSENPRIAYKGPAGTGKTFLAIESARRAVSKGIKTLFCCYNSLLGEWLKQQKELISNGNSYLLDIGTFHSVLLKLAGVKYAETISNEFWEKTLPEMVIEKILKEELSTPCWDYIIIDEAQDLIFEEYLDVMDLLLKDGIQEGYWTIYGDFEKQAIYSKYLKKQKKNALKHLSEKVKHFFSFPLRVNCRNNEDIASHIELIGRLNPGYSKVLNEGFGNDVEISFFMKSDTDTGVLKKKLLNLLKSFKPSEIIILSPIKNENSCAGRLQNVESDLKLIPLRNNTDKSNAINYTTVHAFKGLEAPAVILTDFHQISGERAESLFYVGLTRARMKLVVQLPENCRKSYIRLLNEAYLSQ